MTDAAPTSLQESILAALVFEDKAGAAIATQVAPSLFDETYREIAEKVLAYRRKYGRGPGRTHLDDLFDKRLQENNRPSRVRRILLDLAAIAPELNADYVIARTQRFVREQQLKAALVEANSRWEQGGDDVAPDIEGILHGALKLRARGLDAGTFLSDPERALAFLDRNEENGISFGIKQLNAANLYMRPKELTLYIAAKAHGKTWAAVHVGKQALLERKRVLHITLEVSEELVAARYLQSIFGAGTHSEEFVRTFFEVNRSNELVDVFTRKLRPKWSFAAPGARKEIRRRHKTWGTKFDRLVIKEFPSGALTLPHLEAYLDYLDQEFKFQPNLLIIDYPDLMAQDAKNYRISLGRTFVSVRGILVDRRMAGFFPTQGNRSSLKAAKVSTDMVAEDVSKINTADIVLTYSRTEDEKAINLARLNVANARNNRDGLWLIISQSYDTGQYALDSVSLNTNYWDLIKANPEAAEEA